MARPDQSRKSDNNSHQIGIDRKIALLARRQHEPVHRDQLIELGLEPWQIRYRLKIERFSEVHPQVYTLGYRELDALGSWSAAVLACEPDAALACRSSGQLFQIVDYYRGPVEVVIPRKHKPELKGVRCRTATLGPYDRVRRKDIWVTSLPRTLLDLAGVLGFDELSDAYQRALRIRLRVKHLEDVIARNPNAKGRSQLKKLIERHRHDKGFGAGGFENAFYPWLLSWLPKRFTVQRNVKVPFDDGITREADFLIDNAVWIEVDHYGHHAGAGPQKASEDLQRDRIVGKHYKLGRYTDWEFTHDKPTIRAHIEELLGLDG